MKIRIDVNCDMSEGFGSWMFGDDVDAVMMPLVSSINVGAGFHAGDPNTIDRTVGLAKEHGVG
ncbi:MAG: LamB/YcsF family protein, partial [Nocardioides sp.]